MRPLVLLCLIVPLAAQASLLKCTDGKGHVTYTNSPCAKVGLKEVAVIPSPPLPARDTSVRTSESAKTVTEKNTGNPKATETASLQLMKSMQTDGNQCAKLNSAMGGIMDEMDAARRKGQSDNADSAWNEKLKTLQAEKNRLGCF